MPHGSSDSYILAQEECAGRSIRFVKIVIVASDNRKALRAGVPVDLTVAFSQILITHIVKRFVNRQTAGIGMVAAKKASRGREERLRQLGTCATVPEKRREHACIQTAWEGAVVAHIDQPSRDQRLQNGILVALFETRSMRHTSCRISDGIECYGPDAGIVNLVDVV